MQTLYSLYAAQIATLVWLAIGGEPRSVVVGIALRKSRGDEDGELGEDEQQTFHGVMEALQTILK
jgi:proteasome assembly chaperone 3